MLPQIPRYAIVTTSGQKSHQSTLFLHALSVTENGLVNLILNERGGWKFVTKTAVTMTA